MKFIILSIVLILVSGCINAPIIDTSEIKKQTKEKIDYIQNIEDICIDYNGNESCISNTSITLPNISIKTENNT